MEQQQVERSPLLIDSTGARVPQDASPGIPPPSLLPLSAPPRLFSLERLRSLYPVSIFCVTSALLFADQNLMAPNLTDIAKSFDFDESERDKYLGGYIGAAFYMFGAPAAILFGYLSTYVSRRLLFVIAVLLGEGPCLLTIFVTSYWQLFVLRLLTGISIGGCLPLIFSLLSDMYEHEQRSLVSAVVQVAVGMGIAAGQGVAGYIGPWLGWRWPFVLVAIPAILCAGLMYATTEEPERGSTERAFQAETSKVRVLFCWRVAGHMFPGGLLLKSISWMHHSHLLAVARCSHPPSTALTRSRSPGHSRVRKGGTRSTTRTSAATKWLACSPSGPTYTP
jgi:MFS family permease